MLGKFDGTLSGRLENVEPVLGVYELQHSCQWTYLVANYLGTCHRSGRVLLDFIRGELDSSNRLTGIKVICKSDAIIANEIVELTQSISQEVIGPSTQR
jgi:hypothetical protein